MLASFGMKLFCALALACLGNTAGRTVDIWCNASASSDSSTIAAALASSTNGDEVVFHGHCVVVETVVLGGDRTYRGDSRSGTIIQQADDTNLPAVVASDTYAANESWTGSPVRIAHMTIDGNSKANNGSTGLLLRSWLSTVEDLIVKDSPVDGICISNLAQDGTALKTTQVNGRISGCMVSDSGRHGVHIQDTGNAVTDSSLLNCWIANSAQSAVFMENAAGWQVRGNHLYGVGEHAIYGDRCFATTIADNYIEDFGAKGGNESMSWYGIACVLQGETGSSIHSNKVFQLHPKPAGDANYVYIGVPSVHEGTGVISVASNVIRGWNGTTDSGLSFAAGDGKTVLVSSSGNLVVSAGVARKLGEGAQLVDSV